MVLNYHLKNGYRQNDSFQMLPDIRSMDPNFEILRDKIKNTPNFKGVNCNCNLIKNERWGLMNILRLRQEKKKRERYWGQPVIPFRKVIREMSKKWCRVNVF